MESRRVENNKGKLFLNKYQLRIGLMCYLGFLVATPSIYSLYSFILDAIASTISICATLTFIGYLSSRKPESKNILNRQMQLNFYLKLLYYPLYITMIYVGYKLKTDSKNNEIEHFLASTFLSYSSTRIWLILIITMYALISASRALLFISPATFLSLNSKIGYRISILIILIVLITEVCLSQIIFSPTRCEYNEKGHKIHALVNFFTNETTPESATSLSPKTCTLFPSFRIALFILISFELIRLAVALIRFWRKINNRTIGPGFPTNKNQSTTELQVKENNINISKIKKENMGNQTTTSESIGQDGQEHKTSRLIYVVPLPKFDMPCGSTVSNQNCPPAIQTLKRSHSVPLILNKCKNQARKRQSSLSNDIEVSLGVQVINNSKITEKSLVSTFNTFKQNRNNMKEFKNYIALLIWRTYSLVIIVIFLYLVAGFLPNKIYFIRQLRLQSMVVKLDLFFIPIFWILVDKEVWHFTLQNIKNKFISLKLMLMRE